MDYRARARQIAVEEGVHPDLFEKLVQAESGFNPSARSPAGAQGLTQLMPGTAGDLGVDANDPEQNLRGGARYLRQQIDRFKSTPLALAAYNAGPGRVSRAGGIPRIAETEAYVRKIGGDPSAQSGADIFGDEPAAVPQAAAPAQPSIRRGTDGTIEIDINEGHGSSGSGADIFADEPSAPQTVPAPINPEKDKALADVRTGLSQLEKGPMAGFNAGQMAHARGATLGLLDEGIGATFAAGTGLANLLRKVRGEKIPYGMRDAYDAARQASNEQAGRAKEAHPILETVNEVAGGAWLPVGKFLGSSKGLQLALRSAGVGSGIGAVSGAASSEDGGRISGAIKGALVGGAIGGIAPMAADGIGKAATLTKRLANRASGGRLIDPAVEANSRLRAALDADGITADDILAADRQAEAIGAPKPALIDIARAHPSGGQNTIRLVRGAASKGSGAGVAVKNVDAVANRTQDSAMARARSMSEDRRAIPAIESEQAAKLATLTEAPSYQRGQGGSAVSADLNSRFDEANNGVQQAFKEARNAAPEAAYIQEPARIAANIRDAVRDFDPLRVPSVARELDRLDTLSTPTVRDMFELRSRLSRLRGSSDAVESAAAGTALRSLDGQVDEAVARGAIAGDPGVVDMWRKAISARRDLGQKFEGDDAIEVLTARARRGGSASQEVSPEDASDLLLGRTGVAPKQNMTRDLTRMRDFLGADSDAWRKLQGEAAGRLLGIDSGSEKFGNALLAFQRNNPELAAVLIPQEAAATTAAARGGIADVVADRGALEAGRGVLHKLPEDFSAGISSVDNARRSLSQVGAARDIEAAIGRPAEGSTGVLNRTATSPNVKRNLKEAFGESEADAFQAAIKAHIDQLANARFVSPNTNSQTAGKLEDMGLIDAIPTSKTGAIMAILSKLKNGISLTDVERKLLVETGVGDGVKAAPVLNGKRLPKAGKASAPLAASIAAILSRN